MNVRTPQMTHEDLVLFKAAKQCDVNKIEQILKRGAFTPGILDEEGRTPLHAMSGGWCWLGGSNATRFESTARQLIDAGFALDILDAQGFSACDLAVFTHMHALAHAFIRLGADPSLALLRFAAVGSSSAKASDALGYVDLGADPGARDALGRGYLELAQEGNMKSRPDILALFESMELRSAMAQPQGPGAAPTRARL